jgi:hypothetical protein
MITKCGKGFFKIPVWMITAAILAAVLVDCTQPSREELMTIQQDVPQRLEQFVPIVIQADLSGLTSNAKTVLDKLILAAKEIDQIFLLQAWPENPSFRNRLLRQEGDLATAALEYFDIMYGPWDRQAHREPFVGTVPHPPGAGYYPEDLSRREFEAYLEAHPEAEKDLMSWYTVVRRDGENLIAIPYSEIYREHLVKAAELLREASAAAENESLKRFLANRAESFLSDDYYQSEKDWMDLDSRIEVTIGPYEVYEDELMAQKTAFEAFITVSDPEASEALAKFKQLLPAMEMNLPIPDELKSERGAESPIRVVDLVYSAGDTRAGVQTIAFNLPNDERIRTEKGSKKVMLRNVMKAKFQSILLPIASEVIHESQIDQLSAEAFFQETVFHELSHGLGPGFVKGKDSLEVREALQELYSTVEEAKADAMGAFNILYMIDREEFPREFRNQLLVTYFAGLFRSVRFGTGEAHGRGAATQINYFLEKDAAQLKENGKFLVNLGKLEKSIRDLVEEICLLQSAGDKEQANRLLTEKGRLTPPIDQVLDRLADIPVDIRPVFTGAGETMP